MKTKKIINNDIYFEPNIYDIIRKNIKKYRNNKKLTSEQLALMIGLEPDTIRHIESEKVGTNFSVDTLYRISVALDTTLDKFVEK